MQLWDGVTIFELHIFVQNCFYRTQKVKHKIVKDQKKPSFEINEQSFIIDLQIQYPSFHPCEAKDLYATFISKSKLFSPHRYKVQKERNKERRDGKLMITIAQSYLYIWQLACQAWQKSQAKMKLSLQSLIFFHWNLHIL